MTPTICCLKATPDGFCYIVVVVDYFTKWIEPKALKDKTAVSVAQFLYECICRHGVPAIQINDQGREFVNSVSSELHRLTGTEQRVTSAYHPQANGLVERNNRTIQNSLLKVLNQKPEDWPDALPGVLFAYNTSRHKSTKYTPFFLLYGRDAVLPVHVSNHAIEEEVSEDTIDSTDTAAVQARVDDMIKIRQQIFPAAKKNIDSAQARQQRDYRTRHRNKATFSIGDNVLVWDSRRSSRKGGKDSDPWKGPYVVASVSQNSLCQVKTIKSLETLKTKYHTCNLKKYNMPSPKSPANPSSQSSVSPPSASVTLLPPPPKVPRPLSAFTHQPGSDSSSSEDDDIVTTTSTTSTLRFTPTDSNWRNHAAHKLGLPIRKGRFTSRMASTIGEPRIIDHILGDGNCLFRALSKEVTGTEKHHMTVRNKVVSVLENPSHTKNFESYSGHADMTEYVSKSRMGDNATWATDIEILAAASLLDTPIVIHTQLSTGKKWLKYDPLCVVPPVVDTELCIYLTNYHEHFNRVVSISK